MHLSGHLGELERKDMANDNLEKEEAGKLPEDALEARRVIRAAVTRRRQAIVYELARRFVKRFERHLVVEEQDIKSDHEGWISVESLSQLRAVVGGRFQNLKKKWTGAGLPLRDHRGDRSGSADLSSEGWVELSLWINKQGYEVRLSEDEEGLFEVRKMEAAV